MKFKIIELKTSEGGITVQDLQNKPNIGEMFNIQEKENGEIAISGRELHQALEVKTRYNDF